jgi:hypothetical protein
MVSVASFIANFTVIPPRKRGPSASGGAQPLDPRFRGGIKKGSGAW